MTRIVHLVDDTSPGGVTRFLEYLRTSEAAATFGQHDVIPVKVGLSRPSSFDADVIVSHVVLSWKNLPFIFALRAKHPGTPLIHIEHSYSPAFEQLHVTSKRRFRAMLTVSLSLFDRVVAISEAQKSWLRSAAGVGDKKLALIPSYVDLSEFLAIAPVTGDIRSIGAFGRLDPQKGFDILIPAFQKASLEGVTLEIFGDGPERSHLEALAGGDPNIIFHGFSDDPASAMASVDALAMPSRREPYGLVAIEAMAAGRALLVSRVDGLIDHARSGAISVERLTVEDWSRALAALPRLTDTNKRRQARHNAARAEGQFIRGWSALLDSVSA